MRGKKEDLATVSCTTVSFFSKNIYGLQFAEVNTRLQRNKCVIDSASFFLFKNVPRL